MLPGKKLTAKDKQLIEIYAGEIHRKSGEKQQRQDHNKYIPIHTELVQGIYVRPVTLCLLLSSKLNHKGKEGNENQLETELRLEPAVDIIVCKVYDAAYSMEASFTVDISAFDEYFNYLDAVYLNVSKVYRPKSSLWWIEHMKRVIVVVLKRDISRSIRGELLKQSSSLGELVAYVSKASIENMVSANCPRRDAGNNNVDTQSLPNIHVGSPRSINSSVKFFIDPNDVNDKKPSALSPVENNDTMSVVSGISETESTSALLPVLMDPDAAALAAEILQIPRPDSRKGLRSRGSNISYLTAEESVELDSLAIRRPGDDDGFEPRGNNAVLDVLDMSLFHVRFDGSLPSSRKPSLKLEPIDANRCLVPNGDVQVVNNVSAQTGNETEDNAISVNAVTNTDASNILDDLNADETRNVSSQIDVDDVGERKQGDNDIDGEISNHKTLAINDPNPLLEDTRSIDREDEAEMSIKVSDKGSQGVNFTGEDEGALDINGGSYDGDSISDESFDSQTSFLSNSGSAMFDSAESAFLFSETFMLGFKPPKKKEIRKVTMLRSEKLVRRMITKGRALHSHSPKFRNKPLSKTESKLLDSPFAKIQMPASVCAPSLMEKMRELEDYVDDNEGNIHTAHDWSLRDGL